MATLLDASALLAYLHDEAGADRVTEAIAAGGAAISVVNWSETLSKWADLGEDAEGLAAQLEEEGLIGGTLELVPLTAEDAVVVAKLRPITRGRGLSLGDRACIATALRLGATALTADGAWRELEIEGLYAEVIR